jgi:hypothetical protein
MRSTQQDCYRAVFKVEFLPNHPRFFELQFGQVFIYLLDDDPESALRRATAIVAQLPYEVRSEFLQKVKPDVTTFKRPEDRADITEARSSGFAWRILGWPTGTDPTEFYSEQAEA